MKYCQNCGNKLNNDASFCDNCGNEVNKNLNNKNKKKKSTLNFIVIVISLLIILAVIFKFIQDKNNIERNDSIYLENINYILNK